MTIWLDSHPIIAHLIMCVNAFFIFIQISNEVGPIWFGGMPLIRLFINYRSVTSTRRFLCSATPSFVRIKDIPSP
jgi:hypothetical protein